MNYLREDTLVLCFVSSDERARAYEIDLFAELRAKRLGQLIGIVPDNTPSDLFDHVVTAMASGLPDPFRARFEIVFAQLLAFHLTLRFGLDPDNPSPEGIINLV